MRQEIEDDLVLTSDRGFSIRGAAGRAQSLYSMRRDRQ